MEGKDGEGSTPRGQGVAGSDLGLCILRGAGKCIHLIGLPWQSSTGWWLKQ